MPFILRIKDYRNILTDISIIKELLKEGVILKCKDCGETNASREYYTGEMLCEKCSRQYAECPECGKLFDKNDDSIAMSGKCYNCVYEE